MKPGMNLYYQYTLSKGGKIYKKSRNRICRSFVKQYAQMMATWMGSASISYLDTSNNSKAFVSGYGTTTINAGAGTTAYGSVVGTGTNAVTINDYKLQTQIAHGTGSGQLQHSACTVSLSAFTPSVAELVINRLFTNASGSDITVNEIGLYVAATSNDCYACWARDLATIVVTNGSTLTLNYKIQTTI